MRFFVTVLLFFLLVPYNTCNAQGKYWVFFTDKDTTIQAPQVSNLTMANRAKSGLPEAQHSDLPVTFEYSDSLRNLGINIIHTSKWLNAVSVSGNSSDNLFILDTLDFVDKVEAIDPAIQLLPTELGTSDPNLYHAIEALNIADLATHGLDGSGIAIGIIDGGFLGAHKDESLSEILNSGRFLGYRNYIETDIDDPFTGKKSNQDDHGARVWRMIAGATKKMQFGLATGAEFYLARTDQGDKEYRGEEDNWIAAMEWMDSVGVRLINTSLGYSFGYDNPEENYLPEQVDGSFARITRVAQMAAEEKGLLLVVSAGNEGHNNFQVLSIPADAEYVFSIGSTSNGITLKQAFSSIGPEWLKYLKPDVSCFSNSGTSFSAPIITGLAACIMQYAPDYTNFEIMEVIRKSSNLYPYGNNYVGHGIPDAKKILELIDNMPPTESRVVQTISLPDGKDTYTIATGDRTAFFHKDSPTHVVAQGALSPDNGVIIVQRPEGVNFTTLVNSELLIELVWE